MLYLYIWYKILDELYIHCTSKVWCNCVCKSETVRELPGSSGEFFQDPAAVAVQGNVALVKVKEIPCSCKAVNHNWKKGCVQMRINHSFCNSTVGGDILQGCSGIFCYPVLIHNNDQTGILPVTVRIIKIINFTVKCSGQIGSICQFLYNSELNLSRKRIFLR